MTRQTRQGTRLAALGMLLLTLELATGRAIVPPAMAAVESDRVQGWARTAGTVGRALVGAAGATLAAPHGTCTGRACGAHPVLIRVKKLRYASFSAIDLAWRNSSR